MKTSIRDVIRQRKPFDSLQTEVLLTMLRTMDLVLERSHRPICDRGVTSAQYNVLRTLRGAGATGLHTYEVAERLVTRAPNITRLVDKLERKGLLDRRRSDEDRRVVQLHITDAGLDLLAELDAPVAESTKHALEGLDEAGLRDLRDRLNLVRQPLEEALTR